MIETLVICPQSIAKRLYVYIRPRLGWLLQLLTPRTPIPVERVIDFSGAAAAPMAGQDGSREPPDRSPSTTYNVTPKRGGSENGCGYKSFPGYNRASPRAFNARPPTRSGSSGSSGPPVKPAGARVLAPDLLRGLLMMVMSLDHAALALHTWEHGTGRVAEADGQVVQRWNSTAAYAVRTLAHLCGAGFTFLLGMGVVYLGRSRAGLGWSAPRLARYFAVRCAVLTLVTAVFGLVMTGGRVWFLNAVLFSLAVDYLLAGLLWLAMNRTEGWLTLAMTQMRRGRRDHDESAADDGEGFRRPLLRAPDDARATAESCAYLSWSIHNVLLLVLSLVTVFWNIWLSDGGGVCPPFDEDVSTRSSPSNPLLRVWFWVMMDVESRVVSAFPPLAWLSFALLGILYARVTTARPWSRRALVLGHVLAAVCSSALFVLTRVLHLGNLSERCLQTPDQQRRPGQNQYLASAASFFYVVKYPPDVAFFALTMAGNLLLLALFTAVPPRVARRLTMLLDFGTSALFFYIVHMAVLFGAGMLVVAAFGRETGVADPMDPEKTKGIDNLLVYFGFYAVMMVVLWPLCRAYSRFKSTKGPDSIWRFF
ncbi:hypothetical protein MAC_02493 [Metarhizium acridum CQMa 102]|uniref:Heparan-alpha-glucosaminide N-acetyltransferase catalytic domain-containing protein n=1 Tax=Metarhizium acridum (strain CQMa 102) TaxID=655827 RepID=E9DXZ5_METAQ|nr:uncharacterized protein MAC_02493 [Metarhizium acridum CQMa 102]EFY91608.1 hypothetical protein MAC_02493 [Metarhizium acridum CQMa 102]